MRYIKKSLLLFIIVLITFSSCLRRASISNERPNIIIILADDLGYGDLGCYGQEAIKTPCIDQMAKDGLRFTQFYAGGPSCTSSRACLMTGFHNGNTAIKTMEKSLEDREITLGEMLKSAGYKTATIGKWGMGGIGTEGSPNGQGFDYSYGYYSQIRSHNNYPDYLYENEQKILLDNDVVYIKDVAHYAVGIGNAATQKNTYSNQLFTDKGLHFIDESTDDPFFLVMSYTIPHPNNESWLTGDCGIEVPDYGIYETTKWPEIQKAGAAAISLLDKYVGDLLAKLKEKNIADNTIVIFTSDNGSHGEGGWRTDFFDSNGVFRGLKRDMYEGGIRVPFIVWCPSKVTSGISDHIGAFWDIMPTFSEMAGVESPPTDGVSIVPVLEGRPAKEEHEYLYWEFRSTTFKQAVRMGDWKAIRFKDNGRLHATELYNLRLDEVEHYDVASENKSVVKELENIMNTYNY